MYSYGAPLLICCLFIASVAVFGTASIYLGLVKLLGKALATWAALILPGFYIIRLCFRRRLSPDSALVLGPLVTTAAAALLGIILYTVRAPHYIYTAAIAAGLAALAWKVFRRGLARDILSVRPSIRIIAGMTIAASLMALLFVSAGATDPQRDVKAWGQVAKRFWWPLPVDNNLQYETALVFMQKKPPWVWDPPGTNWTMGDRPPMVGMLNAVYGSFFRGSLTFWDYQVNGTILNSLFLLPLGALALMLFRRRSVAFALVALSCLNTYTFMNLYFTWPKMAALYFTLCALFLAAARLRVAAPVRFALAGAAAGLGSMCHAGALLSLPTLCAYVFFIKKSSPLIKRVAAAALCAAVCLVMQAPWIAYKKAHPEIDTNKLMYHYMPPQYVPKLNYTRNIQDALVRFFRETPLDVQIKQRRENIAKAFATSQADLLKQGILRGRWDEYFKGFGRSEFFYPVTTLGEVTLTAAGALLLLGMIRFVRRRPIGVLKLEYTLSVIAAIAMLFYLTNVAGRWIEPVNHELPCFELCMFMLCLWGYRWRRTRLLGMLLLAATALRWLYYTLGVLWGAGAAPFDLYHTTALGIAAAMTLFVCAASFVRDTAKAAALMLLLKKATHCP